MDSKEKKKCTWCGDLIESDAIRVEDTGNVVHYFHQECFADYKRYMRERV